jgi:hypothetical protein
MTVAELRKALIDVADDAEVTLFFPNRVTPDCPLPYMAHTVEAKFCPADGIGGNELKITVGKGFEY